MQIKNIKKVNENTISIQRVIPERVETETYSLDILNKQKQSLVSQKEEYNTKIDAQIAEIDLLLEKFN